MSTMALASQPSRDRSSESRAKLRSIPPTSGLLCVTMATRRWARASDRSDEEVTGTPSTMATGHGHDRLVDVHHAPSHELRVEAALPQPPRLDGERAAEVEGREAVNARDQPVDVVGDDRVRPVHGGQPFDAESGRHNRKTHAERLDDLHPHPASGP